MEFTKIARKNSLGIKVSILFLLIFTRGIFSQNLIKNPSFEEGDQHWKSKGNTMERHHQSILKVRPKQGEYYAELANDTGYELFQTVETQIGKFYQVSFYAQARPHMPERESHLVFKVGDQLMAKLQPDHEVWNQYRYTVKATKDNMTISFEDTYYGEDGIGAMIDLVEVRELQNGFIPIFNKETLDGWKVYGSPLDVEKKYWKVENNAITCNTMGDKDHGAVWLFYEEELKDFELKIKFQAYRDSPGNSGLQVRSRFYEGGDIDGPQFDIHPPDPFRTALLYDESDGYNRWIYPSMPNSALTQ
ncbi:MAG: family 16 glycoside hydrolase, partial [Flavobacteriaceae bacterium]